MTTINLQRLTGSIVRRLARSRVALPVKRIVRHALESYYHADVLNRLQEKTAPITLDIDTAQPRRVNVVIPEINFATFYGGYIAKFNLARKLLDYGHRVRLVLVDQTNVDPSVWRRRIQQYQGLEKIFDRVEVAHCFPREKTRLTLNPGDGFIATTWWTAWITQDLVKRTGSGPFVYLVQEYEPFTFSMGSYYAMARESYELEHFGLYSTALLREYFATRGIGSTAGDDRLSASFENAVISFGEDEIRAVPRSGHKLLFYARPEAHASRNMFETGYQALSRCISDGDFDNGAWEFYGIGTEHGDIPLPRGRVLKMLGKVGLKEYRDLLVRHDLGLGLMYTPHPSLLPLEMAAAGMVVVTNECENKTAAKLSQISPNIRAGKATAHGVAETLKKAISAVEDMGARVAGSRINWSTSWDSTFNARIMDKLCRWLGSGETKGKVLGGK